MKHAQDSSWLICPQPRPEAGMRLLGFPYAGGGAPVFRFWGKDLPQEIEFYAVQLPGRGSRIREPCFSQMQPLVQALGEVLQLLLDKPLIFFGYSLGALIMFEVSRWLRRFGLSLPGRLFAVACQAPQLFTMKGPDPKIPVYSLPEPDLLNFLEGFQFTPAKALLENKSLRELFLPTIRADLEIGATYHYLSESPLDIPITTIGGDHDPLVSLNQLRAWKQQTSKEFHCHEISAGHDFLEAERDLLLELIRRELIPAQPIDQSSR
jgi:surfactin synthase thioesterase subunit